MSKSKKATAKRKRDAQSNSIPDAKRPKSTVGLPTPDLSDEQSEPKTLGAVVSEEEVEITVETLRSLAEHPSVIKSKRCKELRAAVYDFKQACTTGMNTSADSNLTARVSASLVDGKYVDAMVLMAEMRIRNETPKLGALCRWIRDLDVTSGLSQADGINKPSRPELLRVMDAILRVCGPVDSLSGAATSPVESQAGAPYPIALQKLWDLRDETTHFPMRQNVLDGTIFKTFSPAVKERFKAIETTPGPRRKPPNLHPAVLYLSDDNAVQLSSNSPQITYQKHPIVPTLSIMKDVLSREECKAIIAATESVGFLPDAPIKEDGSDSSILAHNVYWIVDQAFHDSLWNRVRPFIPSDLDGRKVRGINRRFRVYRYVPGAEYRCHFDGAWPPSGINAQTGKYMYDASPADAKQSSLITFLVYLNDEFEGGETTFFTPNVREGVMNAHPVRPMMGSIALFPHGETKALLHEGTGVRKGAKYIIRTDVEYDVVARLAD